MVGNCEHFFEWFDCTAQFFERQFLPRCVQPREHLFAQVAQVGAVVNRQQSADAGVLSNKRARLPQLVGKASFPRQ